MRVPGKTAVGCEAPPWETLRCIVLVTVVGLSPGTSPSQAAETVLVQFGSPMAYLANSADPEIGLTWTAPSFSDAAWAVGVYGVGYETSTGAQNLIRTSVPPGTSSVYTRATFTIADVSAVSNLFIGADYDDGWVAWINGVEVYRSPEMPAPGPAWNTRASLHESSNGATPNYGVPVDISAGGIPALRDGDNVLAAGVWNSTLPSSDLVLVPRLSMNRLASITRGPYLQIGTPSSVVVRWRTDLPVNSRVEYGDLPGNLAAHVDDAAVTTEHVVALTGLFPRTTYYYAVGTTSGPLSGRPAVYFFVTAPEVGDRVPTRLWVLGDSGTANASARAVRNAYLAFTRGTHTNLWLMLGDNAYPDGTDAQHQAAVFDTYPTILSSSVLWPTLGNHDGHTADSRTQTGPYYDIFTLPARGEAGGVPSGTEAYYSFDYGNIHFICLESYETDRSSSGAMMTWLREDLLATNQDWIIAFWHHPPYSKGSHDSDREIELIEMRENALPILEDGGVDLVLTGHSHSYERSLLLDGHYGPSGTLAPGMKVDAGSGRADASGAYEKAGFGPAPHEGAVHVVAGSSGQASGGALNHPAMFLSLNSLGSLVLDVNGGRLDATFLDQSGARRDYFTILKQINHPPVAAAGSDLAAECSSAAGAAVTLDGSASSDADSTPGTTDDIVLYEWFEDLGLPSESLLGTGAVLSVDLTSGAHAITLRVTDRAGETATDELLVTVMDTTPPAIDVTVAPGVLWPPSHRMIKVRAGVAAADACGAPAVVLLSVTSDEPDDAQGSGDGNTANDIQDADLGTADFEIRLRAERDGWGDGRTYTITYEAVDGVGLASTATARVLVPHSRGGRRGPWEPCEPAAHGRARGRNACPPIPSDDFRP